MSFIPLTGGAYQNRSLMAAAQSCVNLIPEQLPQSTGEPISHAHELTPACRLFTNVGTGPIRGLFRASSGSLYCVTGADVYLIGPASNALLGTMATAAGMVSMADNSVTLLIVDGTAAGYTVRLSDNAFGTVAAAAFYGGNRVAVLDGFFCLNRPGTNQFYLSDAIATTFPALYIAAKPGLDRLISLVVLARELWLFGDSRTEIFSNTGAADFPLASMSGGIDQGCVAAASAVRCETSVFWLSTNREGKGIVLEGRQYQARRVSTPAIEAAIFRYTRIDDAVGWTYQQSGHTIYVLTFPTGNATWCYDLTTQLWHQWSWASTGDRHHGICHAQAYNFAAFNLNVVGDYGSGNLYALDPLLYNDNGDPIQRTRAFPHIRSDGKRLFHRQLVIDAQCGTANVGDPAPQMNLRWSDDHGLNWSAPVSTSMGVSGAGNTSMQFRRLGFSRSRIYECSWTADVPTVLTGAFLEAEAAGT